MKNVSNLIFAVVAMFLFTSWSPKQTTQTFFYSCDVVYENNLVYNITDIELTTDDGYWHTGGLSGSSSGPVSGAASWTTPSIFIEVTMPQRNWGSIDIYELTYNTLVTSIPLTSSTYYYYTYNNPPASGIRIEINPLPL
jgi:hypothetical protein